MGASRVGPGRDDLVKKTFSRHAASALWHALTTSTPQKRSAIRIHKRILRAAEAGSLDEKTGVNEKACIFCQNPKDAPDSRSFRAGEIELDGEAWEYLDDCVEVAIKSNKVTGQLANIYGDLIEILDEVFPDDVNDSDTKESAKK